MKEIVKIGLFLMFVCALAAFGLSMTYKATAPKIEEQKKIARIEAVKEVLEGAVSFEEKQLGDAGESYFIGKDSGGNIVGYALKVSPKGYGGPVSVMVGVGDNGAVKGIRILEMKETPGLGSKAALPEFREQFKGKTDEKLFLRKKDEKTGEIDAITAATITSKAVTKGVREAVEAIKNADK